MNWKRIALMVVVGCILAAGFLTAGKANATPAGCQDDLWWTLQSTRRLLCDGPKFDDGHWNRLRILYTPAHQVPLTTSCSRYSCTSYGGYFVDYAESDHEIYPVNPATRLPDEPDYLGDATLAYTGGGVQIS